MEQIDRYEILEVLGDGGMGTVYKGRDPRFDRLVAIKVLHPQFRRDLQLVERFKTEAVIQAKLNHPHVVTVYDFVVDSRSLAIVMEYVDGRSLDAALREANGPLAPGFATAVLDDVLGAMGWAHARGLVHRDLKPSNILVQEMGERPHGKVTDFGVAKVLGASKLLTATGAKMGTLAYMSPEQIRSPREVDHRSDIYSLGATLYELLTGCAPFDADTEFELMQQIVDEEPVLPSVRNPGVSPAVDIVVVRAMEKSPAARYRDCEAFRAALRRAFESQVDTEAPLATEPPDGGEPDDALGERAWLTESPGIPEVAMSGQAESSQSWGRPQEMLGVTRAIGCVLLCALAMLLLILLLESLLH